MLYREAGQYKTNYAADMAVFPILQDRIGIAVILLIAYVAFPLLGGGIETWLAYVIALGFLVFRPQGLFGEKIIERI